MPLMVHYQAQSRIQEQEQTIGEQGAKLDELANQEEQSEEVVIATAHDASLSAAEYSELMTLRSRVGQLRRRISGTTLAALEVEPSRLREDILIQLEQQFALRVDSLKALLDRYPSQKVPELEYLTNADWLFLVSQRIRDDDEGYRRLMSRARTMAESEFGNRYLEPALEKFASENGGRFPESISKLNPYFEEPISSAILNRWVALPISHFVDQLRKQIEADDWVLTQRSAVDPQFDQRYLLGLNEGHLFSDGPPEFWDAAE